jgi:hypothetical protein
LRQRAGFRCAVSQNLVDITRVGGKFHAFLPRVNEVTPVMIV